MDALVNEIMTDLLKYTLSSDEALLILCITCEHIRMLTTDRNLSDENITCAMQRLEGTDVSMIRHITGELWMSVGIYGMSAFRPVRCKSYATGRQ